MDGPDIAPRADKTPGSYVFWPRNALNNNPTTHCDDLESIYYLLCFIIAGHTRLDLCNSRLPDSKIPRYVSNWMLDEADFVFQNKEGYIRITAFPIPVQDEFKVLEPLAAKLHAFFFDRWIAETPNSTPEEDFTQFLNFFEETIEETDKRQRRETALEQGLNSYGGDAKRIRTEL
ncbi:hypothetical protein JB92DRAFT_3111727 [Gautieria morchelliformis]|nr:hypothetical protein JB92DRAFT_3111727 [Gautieria morchelliformis]